MRLSRNWLLDIGLWIVVGSILVWVGAELTRRVVWLLPYTVGFGAALLVGGVVMEIMKKRRAGSASM